jgi:hypothetical protein
MWVYLTLGVGAAVILVWVIIDYLNVSSILRPLVDKAQLDIGQSEEDFKVEESTIELVDKELGELKNEVATLEKEIATANRTIEEHNLKRQRRAPTSQKLE